MGWRGGVSDVNCQFGRWSETLDFVCQTLPSGDRKSSLPSSKSLAVNSQSLPQIRICFTSLSLINLFTVCLGRYNPADPHSQTVAILLTV